MAHSNETITQALLAFVRESILAEGVAISADSNLRDVGIDSYSVIEMVLFIERQFGIVLPEEKLVPENLQSVSALASSAAESQ